MNALTAITAQLEDLIKAQGFTCITIGINTYQRAESRYFADIHYDDATDTTKCSLACGPSIAAAINKAWEHSLAHRPAHRPARRHLVDEAA